MLHLVSIWEEVIQYIVRISRRDINSWGIVVKTDFSYQQEWGLGSVVLFRILIDKEMLYVLMFNVIWNIIRAGYLNVIWLALNNTVHFALASPHPYCTVHTQFRTRRQSLLPMVQTSPIAVSVMTRHKHHQHRETWTRTITGSTVPMSSTKGGYTYS